MYSNREDRDPDLVKLKRIGSRKVFTELIRITLILKWISQKAFTFIVEHGDGIDKLKDYKNILFEDSVEIIGLEELTNP